MDVEVSDYEILDRANQFRDATNILKKSNKLIPAEVNACLACELYLKYLVYFEKVTYSPMFVVNFMETLSEICIFRHNRQYA